MPHTVRVTNGSVEVSFQREIYTSSIGSSTTIDIIRELIAFSEDAKTPDYYSDHGHWYELAGNEALDERARAIANMWLEVRYHGTAAGDHHVDTLDRTKRTSSGLQSMSEDLFLRSTNHC